MATTSLYAGLLALLYVYLSTRVIKARRTAGVGIGDAGNQQLLRAQRVHANFAEYVPLVLILMVLLEFQSQPLWLIHSTGALLLGGRLIHAYGVSQDPEIIRIRVTGMAMTFCAIITGALANLWVAVS
jgi:uncharacterized protein